MSTDKALESKESEPRKVNPNFYYTENYEDNEGEGYCITECISPESDLYEKQMQFVEGLYDSNISEKLLGYDILGWNKKNEDTVKVTVYENFPSYNRTTSDETERGWDITLMMSHKNEQY